MHTRPHLLTLGTLVLLGLCLSMPLQIAFIYEHGLNDWDLIWDKLTIWNLASIGVFGLCSYASWKGLNWLNWALPLSLGVVTWNNALVAWHGENFGPWVPHMASLAHGLFISLYFISSDVRSVMANQNKRWWLCPKRVQKNLGVWANWGRGEVIKSHTHDLSSNGLFLQMNLEELRKLSDQGQLKIGQEITITIERNQPLAESQEASPFDFNSDQNLIRLKATVVRVMGVSLGHYPTGVGLKAHSADLKSFFEWRNLLKEQEQAQVLSFDSSKKENDDHGQRAA